MSRRHDIQDATGRIEYLPGRGTIQAWGSSAPTASAKGFAPGCLWHNLAGAAGSTLYVNTGTFASAVWTNIDTPALFAVDGVAAGYRLDRGVHVQVAASDTVVTGLATVVAVVVSPKTITIKQEFFAASIGDQAGTPAAGSFLLLSFKPTASGDVTPIAATDFTDNIGVNWIAIGT